MVYRCLLMSAFGMLRPAADTNVLRETNESINEPGANPGDPTGARHAPPSAPAAVRPRGRSHFATRAQNSTSSSSISSGSCLAAAIHSCISGNARIVWE